MVETVFQPRSVSAEDEAAPTEKIGPVDFIVAGALAALTWLFLTVWEFPGLHPSVWSDAAVASGIRPAAGIVPGFYTLVAEIVYGVFGFSYAPAMLRFFGHLALAGIAVGVYAALRELLAFIMRARPQRSARRSLVMQLAAAIGSVAFIVSEPVWTAGQCLSETTLLIALTLGAVEFFFVFLRKGHIKYAYACSALLGLLAAETPVGFLLVGAFVGINYMVLNVIPSLESPFFKPAVMEVGKWYMTFLFLAALVFGIGVNCVTYVQHNGLGAAGETIGSVPLAYLLGYWDRVVSAAAGPSWLMWFGVCFAPFVVAIIRFPAAADEEVFLPYSTGMVFFLCGAIAFSQSASVSALWFWTHFPVTSSYFLSCGALFSATTLAIAVTILGVDAVCRDHGRLARQVFGNDEFDDDDSDVASSRSTAALRRVGLVVVSAFLVLAMLPGRVKSVTRAMLAIVDDTLAETVREAKDASYVFTDGTLDDALELESAKAGRSLFCVSLMGGSSARDVYLRTRGMEEDKEDLFSFRFDGGTGLRSWIRDKPASLSNSVVQIGFDLWKRDGKALPPIGGLLSRPCGWTDDGVREDDVAAAHELCARVLDLYKKGHAAEIDNCTDADAKRVFLAVQWRLARMCLYRGERADLSGDATSAIAEAELSKELNDLNRSYRDLIDAMERQNAQLMQKLTPREGLQLALVRADFTMGKLYGETILAADPENPDANFALGMHYLKERQLSRAEEYLKRCLIRRPNEPAVYNNLAMLQLELGKLAAAEINVNKALKLIPNSAAVLDTKKAIDAAKAKTASPKK